MSYKKVDKALDALSYHEQREIKREAFESAAKDTEIDKYAPPLRGIGEYHWRGLAFALARWLTESDAWGVVFPLDTTADSRRDLLQRLYEGLAECAYCPYCSGAGGHKAGCIVYELREALNE